MRLVRSFVLCGHVKLLSFVFVAVFVFASLVAFSFHIQFDESVTILF